MNGITYEAPIPTGLSRASIEKFAETIAGKLNLDENNSVEKTVNKLGGEINYFGDNENVKTADADGSILARSISDFEIWLSPLTHPVRDRFTIAHELGHLFLHLNNVIEKHGQGTGMVASRHFQDSMSDLEKRAEWEANWFAAAFLMPSEKFKEVYTKHGASVASSYFNVSKQSVDIRAKSLGML